MPKEFILAPSILSADFSHLGDELKTIENAGADWVHVDIMDGHFVPNMSMGRKALEACKEATQLPLDVHLMVELPENFIEWYAQSGADHIDSSHGSNPQYPSSFAAYSRIRLQSRNSHQPWYTGYITGCSAPSG